MTARPTPGVFADLLPPSEPTQAFAIGFAYGQIGEALSLLRLGRATDAAKVLHSAEDMIRKAVPAFAPRHAEIAS